MLVYTTAPLEDPREVRTRFPRLEEIGYDGAFTFEAKHDPFLPLATAAEHTTHLRLGTAIAIAFARNPMNLAGAGLPGEAPHRAPLQHAVVAAGRAHA
jgi:alkanesulfonate monooxygenase SsuD/methylene tetrahydromethanopterin reductase-like flavin-dependent oxidoreductase (luciferase family)